MTAIDAIAQTDTLRVPVDTIYFSGYTGINYKVYEDENWWEHEVEISLGDKVLLTSMKWYPSPDLYNFCNDPNWSDSVCYLRDINNDQIPEVIINVVSGGNNGCESNYIYTIDTIATLIGNFNGVETKLNALRLQDIDGDNIPELLFNDMNFTCWPEGCAGAPAPLLIWKWTGQEYKLANFKFRNFLTDVRSWKDEEDLRKSINSWIKVFYNKPGYSAFPPFIADVMLDYIYMGEYQKADNVFYDLWPKMVDGETQAYNDIWNHAKNSHFWQELQESNW